MNSFAAPEDTLVQQIEIQAAAVRVFTALTDPNELMRWWNWEGKFQLVQAQCDLRPGGKWSMRVRKDNGESVVYGEYRIVASPYLLVYTWNRADEEHPETVVRWDLVEDNGVTTVRVTHSGLSSEDLRAHNSGWSMIVVRLRGYVEG